LIYPITLLPQQPVLRYEHQTAHQQR